MHFRSTNIRTQNRLEEHMKVILAGGSGLIGIELAKELSRYGYTPVILSRKPENIIEVPMGTQVAGWDGKTAAGWGHLVEGCAGIVNLAGENIAGEKFFPTRWSRARKKSIIQSRLDAGKAISEAVQRAEKKPLVVVQSSAIGYYGPLEAERVDESAPAGNDFLAKTCVAWEASTAEIERLGVRRVIIRTGVVLSRKGGAFQRLLFPFQFYIGGPLGSGKQILSWIHISDHVNAIRFLIERSDAQGIFNLTAPNPVTNREFAKTISKILHRPLFLPIPSFAFELIFGEVATVVIDGQCVIPAHLQQLGFSFSFTHAESAIRDLLEHG